MWIAPPDWWPAAKKSRVRYRNCETICPISARTRASIVIYLTLYLSFSPSPALRKIARICFSSYTDYTGTYLPRQKKMRVLSSQKLAYRFINYNTDSLFLPHVPVSSLCTRATSRTLVLGDSFSIPNASRWCCCRKGPWILFLFSSCQHKSLFVLRARQFFQHADHARNWVGCYQARVSSRIIMLNEREVTGNVSSLRIRRGQEERKSRELCDSLC